MCSTDFSGSDTRLLAASGPYRRKKTLCPPKPRFRPPNLPGPSNVCATTSIDSINGWLRRLIAMMELTLGAWVSQAVYAAAELGIADALARRAPAPK